MKSSIKYILFILLTVIIIAIFISSAKDLDEVLYTLKSVNVKYLLLGELIVILYLFFLNQSIDVLARKISPISYNVSMNIANQMNFYNCVTPFQSGGQATALYYYHKHGVDIKKSSSIVMMNFIIYQITIVLFGIVALVCYYGYLKNSVSNFSYLVLIGFVINAAILFGLIILSTVKYVRNFVKWIIRLIGKIKPLKEKMLKVEESLDNYIIDFQDNFKFLLKNPITLILSLISKIIALALLFIVPYFSIKAIGLEFDISKIFFVICMTAACNIFMSYMPTPGASGGAEWAFVTILSSFAGFTDSLALSATLIWRFITYYSVLLFGLISVIVLRFIKSKKDVEEVVE